MLALSAAISVIHAEPAVIFLSERRALRVECGPFGAALVRRIGESPLLSHWLPGVPQRLGAAIVRNLRDCQFLMIGDDGAEAETLSRNCGWLALHGQDVAAARARLAGARVAILGVGGIGSEILRHLAGAGVGNFFLIDGDRVEPSNLNRQYLFGPADFGRAKTEAAAGAIAAAYPAVRIERAPRMVTAPADLACLEGWNADLLVCAADTPVGRIEAIVAEFAGAAGMAWTSAAVGLERGYWGPIYPASGCPCHGCADASAAGEQDWASTLPQVHSPYSFGPSNAVVAGLLARDVLVWLVEGGETDGMAGRRVIDLMTMTITAPAPVRCRACAA